MSTYVSSPTTSPSAVQPATNDHSQLTPLIVRDLSSNPHARLVILERFAENVIPRGRNRIADWKLIAQNEPSRLHEAITHIFDITMCIANVKAHLYDMREEVEGRVVPPSEKCVAQIRKAIRPILAPGPGEYQHLLLPANWPVPTPSKQRSPTIRLSPADISRALSTRKTRSMGIAAQVKAKAVALGRVQQAAVAQAKKATCKRRALRAKRAAAGKEAPVAQPEKAVRPLTPALASPPSPSARKRRSTAAASGKENAVGRKKKTVAAKAKATLKGGEKCRG
ncbi:hypothetical protein BD413DRAFT_579588 [Trametes elegans]|nr:hypothetical protein BD413DRAFT_579588 [Trametes elegans]